MSETKVQAITSLKAFASNLQSRSEDMTDGLNPLYVKDQLIAAGIDNKLVEALVSQVTVISIRYAAIGKAMAQIGKIISEAIEGTE